MPRFLFLALLALFILQCSGYPSAENATNQEKSEHISILDTIPQHIQEIENLTVFPGDSKPRFSIELIPEQTYGKTGEPYLTNILTIVVDDQDRVIILDTKSDYSHVINVFNDDGSFHTQLGGPGRGPGEYGLVVGMQSKASKIFVLDSTNLRLSEYSTIDYSLLRTTLYEQWNSGGDFGYIEARNDGNYLVTFSDRSSLGRRELIYLVMDHEGNNVDFEPLVFPNGYSIGVGEVMRPTMPLSFMGNTITALSDDDELFSAWTPEFLIKKYDNKGIYQSAIYYPIRGLPFDLDEYTPRSRFEPNPQDIRKASSSMEEVLPESFPVINNLMVDDENRIWVAVPMDTSREMLEWWILAPSGELLAKLPLPRESRFVIQNGQLYDKQTVENSGVEFVVKYRIELTTR